MTKTSDDLEATLGALGIEAPTRSHAPVFTVDEMMRLCGDLPGAHTKNLFLRDAKKGYFLVSLLHDAALDLKALRPVIGARGNLSFAGADALMELLGVASGSVSPFALINDVEGRVTLCLQAELVRREVLNFHPLRNDRTTAVGAADLSRFLEAIGHAPTFFDLDPGGGYRKVESSDVAIRG